MTRQRNIKLGIGLLLLVAATGLTISWLVHTARAVREEAETRFFEQYSRQQLLLAKQAGRAIEDLFRTFRNDLTLIVSLFEDREVTFAQAEALRNSLLKVGRSLHDTPVLDLAVFDREGTVVLSLPPSPDTVGTNLAWRDYFVWARDEGKPGEIYVPPFRPLVAGLTRGEKALLVVEGIYGETGAFKGLVLFAVNFAELAKKYILPVRIGEHGYAWLVDTNNRTVLVDPNGKIAGRSFEEALLPRWPELYSLLVSTANGTPGTGWYDFEDPSDPTRTVRKLVGYQPVRIQGHLWTIGVATPQREAEELLSSFLRQQEIFSVTLVVVTLAGTLFLGSLLVFWNRVLARQVSTRTRDLEHARSKLEAAFDEILASRKLVAVGQLARGLAHEIRNPLSSIQINVQMIREETHQGAVLSENFDIVEGEIRRLNRLMEDVLVFARPAPLRLARVDLSAVVEDVLQLTRNMLTEQGVDARHQATRDLWVVCDPAQIRQVLLNLILNAVDAMRDVDRLKILSLGTGQDRTMATLKVSDTGVGINPAAQDQIFDPFFTTKALGGGLGLATVQSIVLRHQGTVDVESDGKSGATFCVRLPVAGPAVANELSP
ncbi:MAG TPA: cache domain-containing protein [Deferrisomatales bacterium]|nr:cache domain-containing protein [Deferrisomatales bacterium]